ncbi:MAG: cysteine desulfurase family protein [Peptoanaerobacter stomatis]|uniref:cysteine desulfurase family protein n=1 Tax=Peptoanaerobacter stomatis TaxID=796937 RepID=UPI003F9ECDEF
MDNSATTMVDYEVINEMLPYFVLNYGNPSSSHLTGKTAYKAVEKAKVQIAKLINCKPNEIYFTSEGTESNNFVLNGVLNASDKYTKHIITSKIEHKSILNTCSYFKDNNLCNVTYLNVDKDGFVNLDELKNSINDNTILVSVMYANNEVGTIQNIQEISGALKDKNIYLHTDATQAIGKIDIDVTALNIDFMTFSGHKLHTPKGVGVLYIREKSKIASFILGGSQQNSMRAGTENVPSIVGLGKACEILYQKQNIFNIHMKKLQDYTFSKLREIPDIIITGSLESRINNIISFCVKDISGNAIVLALDTCGIDCSSGSACNENSITYSHVLKAMNIPDEYIKGAIRLSISKYTKQAEIDYVISKLKIVIETLKDI